MNFVCSLVNESIVCSRSFPLVYIMYLIIIIFIEMTSTLTSYVNCSTATIRNVKEPLLWNVSSEDMFPACSLLWVMMSAMIGMFRSMSRLIRNERKKKSLACFWRRIPPSRMLRLLEVVVAKKPEVFLAWESHLSFQKQRTTTERFHNDSYENDGVDSFIFVCEGTTSDDFDSSSFNRKDSDDYCILYTHNGGK